MFTPYVDTAATCFGSKQPRSCSWQLANVYGANSVTMLRKTQVFSRPKGPLWSPLGLPLSGYRRVKQPRRDTIPHIHLVRRLSISGARILFRLTCLNVAHRHVLPFTFIKTNTFLHRYRVDGSGIETRWREGFLHPSRPALWRTQRPTQCVPGLFRGSKAAGKRGVNHPPTSSAEVKERVQLYFYSPYGPSWPVLGRNLPYLTFLHFLHTYKTCTSNTITHGTSEPDN